MQALPESAKATLTISRWDDWVPQERVRKFTEENKELASNLKKDMDAQRRAATGKPPSLSTATMKRRPYGSDLAGSSARGSEDRSSAAPPPPPRGVKRGREIEGIDKVCGLVFFVLTCCVFPIPRFRQGDLLPVGVRASCMKVATTHRLGVVP